MPEKISFMWKTGGSFTGNCPALSRQTAGTTFSTGRSPTRRSANGCEPSGKPTTVPSGTAKSTGSSRLT